MSSRFLAAKFSRHRQGQNREADEKQMKMLTTGLGLFAWEITHPKTDIISGEVR